MPAAAVIPAPKAYIKVAAVKKLVVGFLARHAWSAALVAREYRPRGCHPSRRGALPSLGARRGAIVYFEKIRVFLAGVAAVNTLAWNNKIGLGFYFVGF